MLLDVEAVHSSMMFRMEDMKANDLWYDPEFQPEDFELFSRAVHVVKMANVPEVLLKYRASYDNTMLSKADRIIEHSREIAARNLRSLEIEVSPSEKPLLNSLKSPLKDKRDLAALRKLSGKILAANEKLRVYDREALAYELRRHYYRLFNPFFKADFPGEIADVVTQNAREMGKLMPLCIFGLGKAARDLLPYFARAGLDIRYVADNDPEKWGRTYCGVTCVPPEKLRGEKDGVGVIVLANFDNMSDIIAGLKRDGFRNVWPYVDPLF
jgi:hypothetical protein